MNRTKPIAIIAVTTIALLAHATPTQSAYKINYKFKDGMNIKVVVTQQADSSMTGMMEMNSKVTSTTTQTYNLKKSEGDMFDFTSKTTDIKMDSGGSYEAMGMNDADMVAQMKTLVTKGKVNAAGKVSDFKLEGEGMAAMLAQTDVMSKTGFLGFSLPDSEVKVDDTWTMELPGKQLIPASEDGTIEATGGSLKVTYTLKSVQDNIATITMVMGGKIDLSFQGAPGNMQPTGTGTITFDMTKGHPTKIEQTFKVITDLDIIVQTVAGKSTVTVTTE